MDIVIPLLSKRFQYSITENGLDECMCALLVCQGARRYRVLRV